ITDHESAVELRVAAFPNAGHNTLGHFSHPSVQTDHIETVAATTLDSFILRCGLTHVDVMKIDIEGAECAALTGAAEILARFRPVLIVEISRAALGQSDAAVAQLVNVLARASYRVCVIDRNGQLTPSPSGHLPADGNIVAVPEE